MNYTLEQLRQLAGQRDAKGLPIKVQLNKRMVNQKTGRIHWKETNPIPASVAFKNMNLPFESRKGGWKSIFW